MLLRKIARRLIRAGLARLLAYGARGPIALERLGTLPDGRLTYQLKRPLPDGRTELVLQPTELLRKLATLVPPPRRNFGPLPWMLRALIRRCGRGRGWRVTLRAGLLPGWSGPTDRAGRRSLRGLDRAATARNHTGRAGPVACSVGRVAVACDLPATGPPKAPARVAAQLELDERPADELRDELPNYEW